MEAFPPTDTQPYKHTPTPRQKFTEEEDAKLKKLVEQFGYGQWRIISQNMGTRSPRQCHERYKNYLDPSLARTPWTPEEEAFLECKVAELGPKWSRISAFFPSRSGANLKNHWASMMNKRKSLLRKELLHSEITTSFISENLEPDIMSFEPCSVWF